MNQEQWKSFTGFRSKYKEYCNNLSRYSNELIQLQKEAAKIDGVPEYNFENPVVYSKAYDEVTVEDEIKLIVIGDNPGKDEQLNKNCKYLVGQSGKIADGFFKKNPELQIDFRKNVLIMNKTPIHTAKTKELKFLVKNGSKEIAKIIADSQIWMAEETAKLHKNLKSADLWIIGYSELKDKQIFTNYRDVFKSAYREDELSWKKVFVFQHFSMNRFLIDLNQHIDKKITLRENLENLGTQHRMEIFGE